MCARHICKATHEQTRREKNPPPPQDELRSDGGVTKCVPAGDLERSLE